MKINIRAAEPEDAKSIKVIRSMPEVLKWMLSYSVESVYTIKKDIIEETSYYLVAENDDKEVIAYCKLEHFKNPRQKHRGKISIAVNPNYQNHGVGTMLLKDILSFADNELKLVKTNLTVMKNNDPALKLYEKFGFNIEGNLLYDCISEGELADVYLMARYNLPNKEGLVSG